MPLKKGKSKKVINSNIEELLPQLQGGWYDRKKPSKSMKKAQNKLLQ